jgi:hypothetical protein
MKDTISYRGDSTITHHFTLEYYYNNFYYESVDSGTFDPDICMECFVEKILPFLKSIGLPIPKWIDNAIRDYERREEELVKSELLE